MSIRILIADCQDLSRKAFTALSDSESNFTAAMHVEPIMWSANSALDLRLEIPFSNPKIRRGLNTLQLPRSK
jgi:hypothetical protein